MDLNHFLRLSKGKQVGYSLAPILFGAIYALYQYDNVYWGRSFIFAFAVVCFFLFLNLLAALSQFHLAEDEQSQEKTLIRQLHINVDSLRRFLFILLGLSSLALLSLGFLSSWTFVALAVGGALLAIFYVYGPRAWKNSVLSEFVFSLGLGMFLPFLSIQLNLLPGQVSLFELWMQVSWISLPLCFAFAIVIIGLNSIRAQRGEAERTLVAHLHYSAIDGFLELCIFLAFVLPMFSIYLDVAPWLMLIQWFVFPKAWWDIKRFIQDKHQAQHFAYLREIFEMIFVFQVSIYALGLFF